MTLFNKKTMKLNKYLAILACGALVFASCQDEDVADNKFAPAQPGDEILFGGAMSFGDGNNAKTRTVYGDKGETGTEIKWYEDDQVRIYCAQATLGEGETDQKYCDYTVTNYIEKPVYNGATLTNPTESNPKGDGNYDVLHQSALKTVDGNPGLCWGEGEHTFYGVYPAPGQLSDAGDDLGANALSLNGNTLTGYLPNTQAPVRYMAPASFTTKNVDGSDLTANHYTIHPAMRNAYMVAKATAKPADGGVTLTFLPVVTAVEITLQNNTTYTNAQNQTVGVALEGVSLINLTSSNVICGSFKTEIGGTYETNVNTNQTTEDSYKTVGVPVKGTDGNPITLNYGDKITFTAFMLLNTDLSQISVSVVTEGMTKVATLSGKNDVKIVQAKKKNFITNVLISWSTVETISLENWVSSIPDNSTETDANGNTIPNYLSGLSIPGAGGAASKLLTTEYDKQQTLYIKELWKRGIRCFEFMCDKGSSLGSQKVVCGTTPVNMTLQQAVDSVAILLKANPKEFAVVILGYQDVDVDNYDRNAGDNGWGGQFHKWWASYNFSGESTVVPGITHAKAILTSTTTVNEARGKLYCIIRPMGIGIDGGWHTGIADNSLYNASTTQYVSALGWGTHPDQWYARGFGNLVTANSASFTAHAGGVANRPYVVNPTNLEDETYVIPTTKSFAYKFVTKSDLNYASATEVCWVQDWRRVVPDKNIREMYGIKAVVEADAIAGFHNNTSYGEEPWKYKWHPSVDEKWTDIVNTLKMSMSDTDGTYKLYINSLCGYFVDGNIPLSFQPRPTFQRYTSNNYYYLDDKYNTSPYVGEDNLVGNGSKPETGSHYVQDGWIIPNIIPSSHSEYYSWGPYQVKGGNEGNIAAYADWVNNKFYNLLLTMQANGELNGPTGIVMMDRVSATADNPAGYYIPQIIIANNFREASASNINVTYSTYTQDDTPAAPVRK